MLDRRRVAPECPVRVAGEQKTPVCDVAESRDPVAGEAVGVGPGGDECRVPGDDEQCDEGRGQEPTGAADPEGLEVDATAPLPLEEEE